MLPTALPPFSEPSSTRIRPHAPVMAITLTMRTCLPLFSPPLPPILPAVALETTAPSQRQPRMALHADTLNTPLR